MTALLGLEPELKEFQHWRGMSLVASCTKTLPEGIGWLVVDGVELQIAAVLE